MLRELHIHQLAVIEDAHIQLSKGLNCFTGQTGAGKSLVMGAFEILLGLKTANAAMLRPGADEARVAGVFELHDPVVTREISQLIDQALAPGDELLISRKIFPSGRSSLTINGQPVTAAMLKSVGETLVDIHGQHDQQYLLKPSNQLTILDAFAKSADLCDIFAKLHRQHGDIARRRSDLAASRVLRQQQLELYEFQASEIDEAVPQPGELKTLRDRHAMLSNVQRIKHDASQVYELMDDSQDAIVGRVQSALHMLQDIARLDRDVQPLVEQFQTAAAILQDSSYELGRYAQRLDVDPEELGIVEERLNVLNRMVAKFAAGGQTGQDPLEQVIAYRQQIQGLIDELRAADEDLSTIDQQAQQLVEQMKQVGAQLTRKRQAAVKKLRPLVEKQLADLGMGEAVFDVALVATERTKGDAGSGESPVAHAGSSQGMETVEMMVQTNPGQPAQPLRKIASGGEMSRIMLALKAILAQSDRVSVLVFDEIDANIGGRMGTVIGQKLRMLADGAHHQVLCITHLPQIAAFADRHLHITKTMQGKGKDRQTHTQVATLQGSSRVEELAQMLAGSKVSTTTRKQVKEMLALAS